MPETRNPGGSDTLADPRLPLSLLDQLVVSDSRGNRSLRFGHYVDLAFEHGDTVDKRKDLAKVLLYPGLPNQHHALFPHDAQQLELIRNIDYEGYLRERAVAPDDPEIYEGFSAAVYVFRVTSIHSNGIMIQAGEKPEIGDVTQAKIPAAYRIVARSLAPIKFESLPIPPLNGPKPLDWLQETLEWVRRFD